MLSSLENGVEEAADGSDGSSNKDLKKTTSCSEGVRYPHVRSGDIDEFAEIVVDLVTNLKSSICFALGLLYDIQAVL